MRRKHYSTVFHQLALFFILAGILPIAVLGLYMYDRVNKLAGQELTHSYEILASQYLGGIQEKLTRYETSLKFITQNTVIIEQLGSTALNSYTRGGMISEEVSKSLILDEQSTIRNCMIYSELKNAPVYGRRVTTKDTAVREKWYPVWQGKMGEWLFYENSAGTGNNLGVLVYPIYQMDLVSLKQEQIGFAKLEIYMERLFAPATEDGSSFRTAVFDEEMQCRYRTDGVEETEALACLEEIRKNGREDESVRIINGQMVCVRNLETCGLKFLLFFGTDGMEQKRREVNSTIIPLILLVMGIDSIGCYLFAGMFSRRVTILVNKFKRVETGDFSATEPISGNDELKVLDDQFTHMLETINALIRENYVQELEKKETELQNLQLQINPHFLYNTLETISSIAAVRQAFTVCDLCGRLGEIFRYSLGKDYGEFVTVEQELHHVENYVFIQKVRYGDKFEVFYHIEPEVRQCMILRFILQPVVENAILHGIAPMTGNGTLKISVGRQGEILYVKVEDNGIGMDSIRKSELEEYISRPENSREDKGSIGVRNVHRRVRLACGDQYGVSIESRPYRGSGFLITFPLRRKGDEECTD
nr:sensor histidine kinase [uncultured Acetatifactor sp.]